MDSKQILYTSVIAVVASLLVAFGLSLFDGNVKGQGAAPGSRTIESMLPGVQQAGGILSSKQMWINASTTLQGLVNIQGALSMGGALTVTGATTQSGDVTVDSTDFFLDVSLNRAGFGTSSPLHDFVVEGVSTSTFTGDGATTTIFVNSNTALFGGEIILENPDGLVCSNIVLDDAGTALVVAVITCPSEAEI